MPSAVVTLAVLAGCAAGAAALSCELNFTRSFDPYATLAVERSASEDAIRRAYRALSLKHSPNKFRAPTAEQLSINFQLRRAYE